MDIDLELSCPPTWKTRVSQPGVISPPTRRIPCPLSLCATIGDRLTFGPNIIETGTSNYRRAKQQPGEAKSSRHPGVKSG